MEQFIEFANNHLELFAALAVTLVLLAISEARKGGAKVTPHIATQMINKENAVVLDIRPKKEFQTGHITGAVNIPFAELDKRISELHKHRDKPVIVVCNLGHTASGAFKKLQEAKFERVSRLSGGITEWKAQNLPIVKK
ncbi:rhodanese-like domain-containing protein [Motiliproteus sediminis]|uniref:rhodanese-like domain-containing protein n=1 Tax=Motiliproteus sediminis TaxID=1468178 RepID=UPI001AEF5F40|nr:rhodanese-like domain-containing protein [Motiliproteus sediminis]